MTNRQNLPSIGEAEKALLAPLYSANIMTTADSGVIVTTFDWHGEVFTKLMMYSPVGSQTMILDGDAVRDIDDAFINARGVAGK